MELVFDIEANGLSEVVINKRINPEVTRVWCMVAKDIHTGKVYKFREDEMHEGVALLRRADTIIGHNIIMYDIPVLERFYGEINTEAVDTLIISRVMYPDIQNHPLGGNSLRHWGLHLGVLKEDYEGGFEDFSEDMLAYCAQDIEVSQAIWAAQASFFTTYKTTISY